MHHSNSACDSCYDYTCIIFSFQRNLKFEIPLVAYDTTIFVFHPHLGKTQPSLIWSQECQIQSVASVIDISLVNMFLDIYATLMNLAVRITCEKYKWHEVIYLLWIRRFDVGFFTTGHTSSINCRYVIKSIAILWRIDRLDDVLLDHSNYSYTFLGPFKSVAYTLTWQKSHHLIL
jgi:hypothetical protein